MLHVVDDALYSAAEAGTSLKEVDENFRMAIDALSAYETKYHPKKIVAQRMERAEVWDKSSSTILSRLKANLRVREELAVLLCCNTNANSQPMREEPTKIVEFHIHKSLPDQSPTIVKRELTLSKSSMVSDFCTRGAQQNLESERNFVELQPF